MKQIKILTVTHKSYDFPQDEIYQPIQVGRVLSTVDLSILSDNEGINISGKNKNFCELTAIYWAWKNHFFADCDYVGLTHYRRFFIGIRDLYIDAKLRCDCASTSQLLD